MATNYDRYVERMRKIADIGHSIAVLNWDKETYLPKKSANMRSQQIATLSGIMHEEFTNPKFGNLLKRLNKQRNLDDDKKKNVTVTLNDYHKATKFTKRFVMQKSMAVSKCFQAWLQAREANCFDLVVVSSDSLEILNISKDWGADMVVQRPKEMASDQSAKFPAIKHCVKYIEDQKADGINVTDKQCENFKAKVYKPLDTYTIAQNEITGGTVSPSYISPIQGLQRLQRIMDEYVGGIATNYMTNANMLKRGLELLAWLEEDLENVGAEDYHQLMRAWELKHRALTSQCVTEHTMFREETRWPGYYYRGDHMKLDDDNWHCLTVSRRDPKTGKFSMEKVPVYHIVDENEKKKAS